MVLFFAGVGIGVCTGVIWLSVASAIHENGRRKN